MLLIWDIVRYPPIQTAVFRLVYVDISIASPTDVGHNAVARRSLLLSLVIDCVALSSSLFCVAVVVYSY
jgi:hypothetical protein